jgi:hypothetical protein
MLIYRIYAWSEMPLFWQNIATLRARLPECFLAILDNDIAKITSKSQKNKLKRLNQDCIYDSPP